MKQERNEAIAKLAHKYFTDSEVLQIKDCLFYIRIITTDHHWYDADNVNGLRLVK